MAQEPPSTRASRLKASALLALLCVASLHVLSAHWNTGVPAAGRPSDADTDALKRALLKALGEYGESSRELQGALGKLEVEADALSRALLKAPGDPSESSRGLPGALGKLKARADALSRALLKSPSDRSESSRGLPAALETLRAEADALSRALLKAPSGPSENSRGPPGTLEELRAAATGAAPAGEAPSAGTRRDDGWEVEALPIMRSSSRGFRPVYVYGGRGLPMANKYSQANQDRIVAGLLDALGAKLRGRAGFEEGRGRYFVDLAANDAVTLSNTLRLEESGWRGLCIEPNPVYWYRLASLRSCTIVGAVVGGAEDGAEVDFRLNEGIGGGITFHGTGGGPQKPAEKRNLVSFSTVLKETNAPSVIDYLSLDVEGDESFVMERFPWGRHLFRVLTVERPNPDLVDLLRRNGYTLVAHLTIWGETLWINAREVSLPREDIVRVIDDVCEKHPYKQQTAKDKRYAL